jgi:streptogramin lyase
MARGPESKYAPFTVFPRPHGTSTRVVITEYELPRVLMSAHDVYGDPQGNIWYTSHKTRYIGRLDPRTGIITEYAVPLTPGIMPGTHHVIADKKGIVWLSENWAHNLTRLDPATGEFKQMHLASPVPLNSPGFGNFGQAPDGSIWGGMNDIDGVVHIDQNTGKILANYPFKAHSSYGALVSDDGHYWAGGSPGEPNGNSAELFDIHSGKMMEFTSGTVLTAAKRGGFDPFGNPWYGGVNGAFVTLDVKAGRIRAFWPPGPYVPYTDFYDALPDGHGEVWGGVLHGRSYMRLDPRTEKWTEYVMPEPYAHDRRTWIDKSTNQVAVWYVDFRLGAIIRIQPKD